MGWELDDMSTPNVTIIDYGVGNLLSVQRGFEYFGASVELTSDPEKILSAQRVVLPGVGAFPKAMQALKSQNLVTVIQELSNKGTPLLAICLGMQLMGISSNEDGLNQGLGFIDATVTRFDDEVLKIPHVGFNQVLISNKLKLFENFNEEYYDFYFTHSYKMKSNSEINQNYCNYQENFVASFEVDNICGTQFHPELSQKNGLKLLTNFIENF
jgi:glutamine amidotransferase